MVTWGHTGLITQRAAGVGAWGSTRSRTERGTGRSRQNRSWSSTRGRAWSSTRRRAWSSTRGSAGGDRGPIAGRGTRGRTGNSRWTDRRSRRWIRRRRTCRLRRRGRRGTSTTGTGSLDRVTTDVFVAITRNSTALCGINEGVLDNDLLTRERVLHVEGELSPAIDTVYLVRKLDVDRHRFIGHETSYPSSLFVHTSHDIHRGVRILGAPGLVHSKRHGSGARNNSHRLGRVAGADIILFQENEITDFTVATIGGS